MSNYTMESMLARMKTDTKAFETSSEDGNYKRIDSANLFYKITTKINEANPDNGVDFEEIVYRIAAPGYTGSESDNLEPDSYVLEGLGEITKYRNTTKVYLKTRESSLVYKPTFIEFNLSNQMDIADIYKLVYPDMGDVYQYDLLKKVHSVFANDNAISVETKAITDNHRVLIIKPKSLIKADVYSNADNYSETETYSMTAFTKGALVIHFVRSNAVDNGINLPNRTLDMGTVESNVLTDYPYVQN